MVMQKNRSVLARARQSSFAAMAALGIGLTQPALACDHAVHDAPVQKVAGIVPASMTAGSAPQTLAIPPHGNQRLQPERALAAINAVRAQNGLTPLSLDPTLTRAAYDHARELAARDDISHYGVNGSTPVTRVAAAGYSAVTTGENLAIGQRRFDDVLEGWLASPSHRRTIMQETVQHAGLALVEDPDTTYRTFWAMVVAEPF